MKYNLGSINLAKKKPVTIALEYNLSCHSNPDIAFAICEFVKSMLGTILELRLGMKFKLKEVDCNPEFQTYCKFEIHKNKK